LWSSTFILEQRNDAGRPVMLIEERGEYVESVFGQLGIGIQNEKKVLISLAGSAVCRVRESVIFGQGDDLEIGEAGRQSFRSAVARTGINEDHPIQTFSAEFHEREQTSANFIAASPPDHHGAYHAVHRRSSDAAPAKTDAAFKAAGANERLGAEGRWERASTNGCATTDQRHPSRWDSRVLRHRVWVRLPSSSSTAAAVAST
jgi:hypothetical protein